MKRKHKAGKLRVWLRRITMVVLGIVVFGIIAVVITASRIERRIQQHLNMAFDNTPGKSLSVESVRLSFLGIYLMNLRYDDEITGLSLRPNIVRIGPWWELPFGIAGNVKGGLVLVDDIERALAPREAVEWKSGTMSFSDIGMDIGVRGERTVLGGTSGKVSFSKTGFLKAEVSIDRVNGEHAGLYGAYDSSGTNRLSLKIDTALFKRRLPEGVSLSGQVYFTGNLSIVPLHGVGRLDVEKICLSLWDITGKNIGGSIKTEVSGESMSLQADLSSGELHTQLAEYDFSEHPATLTSSVSKKGGIYQVEGSFAAPEGVSLKWKGTVTKQAQNAGLRVKAPPLVDMAVHIDSFPIWPLIRSGKVEVTSDGVASRSYQLSGPWPKLEAKAETNVKDLGITWPRLDLAIEGIEAGPLKGQWQTE